MSNCAERQEVATDDQTSENRVGLPQARQQVIAKIVHVQRCLIQRREPTYGNVSFIHQLIRQLEYGFNRLRIQQKPEQAEHEYADDARKLSFGQIEHQHDECHEHGVQQHEREDNQHAFIWRGHFQRFDQRRQRDGFARTGVTENRRRFAPHVPHKTLPHADNGGCSQHEQHIQERCSRDVERLPGHPRPAIDSHEIERRTAGDKGHIGKLQYQQQRGQQDGLAVAKRPHKRFNNLHGSIVFLCKLDRLIREQKAQDEREAKRNDNPRVLVPLSEIIGHHSRNLPRFHMDSSLLRPTT